MAATHTPGPWAAAEKRHGYDVVIRNGDNDPVASVFLAGYGPLTGKANTDLIAAAPTLLEAAQTAISFLRCVEWETDSIGTDAVNIETLLEAAIAKAEGR